MENTTYSFLEFENLQNSEQNLIVSLKGENMDYESKSPKTSSVNAVLAFSKALSIRKSEHLGFIEKVLN